MRYLLPILCSISLTSAFAASGEEMFQKLAPSVWVVKTYDANDMPIGQGSAVVIGPQRLLTNCHVLRKASKVEVNQEKTRAVVRLEFIDVRRDLCQLQADEKFTAPPVALGDSDAVKVGTRVFTLGAPKGLDLTLSSGNITALRRDKKGIFLPTMRDDPKGILLQTDAPISPGSSGGGLFDEEGRLIGLTSAHIRDGQNLNLAIPVNWRHELAERSREQIKAFRRGASKASVTLAEPVASSTVTLPVASGFAEVREIDKVPVVGEKLQKIYAEWLEKGSPRAFAIRNDGRRVAHATGKDAPRRALVLCEKEVGRPHCSLYAIDDRVIWQREPEQRFGLAQLDAQP